jgi:hypothetical protein
VGLVKVHQYENNPCACPGGNPESSEERIHSHVLRLLGFSDLGGVREAEVIPT